MSLMQNGMLIAVSSLLGLVGGLALAAAFGRRPRWMQAPPAARATVASEIERKFLLLGSPTGRGVAIRQGYLADGDPQVRIRVTPTCAELTVKSAERGTGAASTRDEITIPLAPEDAASLFALCPTAITKTRYTQGAWEFDVYHDDLAGLQVAEIELVTDTDPLPPLPAGLQLGPEVSNDKRFGNKALAKGDAAARRAAVAVAHALIAAAPPPAR